MNLTQTLQKLWAPHCQLCRFENKAPGKLLCAGCLCYMPIRDFKEAQIHSVSVPAFAAASYAYPIDQLLHSYKYHNQVQLADLLGELIATLPRPRAGTLLVPMPSSTARIKERGFDHMDLIAQKLANRWGLGVWRGLKRTGHAPKQKTLSRSERYANVANQLTSRPPPLNHTLLILDDVSTTGATLNAAVRSLQGHFAKPADLRVFAYVLAHEFKHSD